MMEWMRAPRELVAQQTVYFLAGQQYRYRYSLVKTCWVAGVTPPPPHAV